MWNEIFIPDNQTNKKKNVFFKKTAFYIKKKLYL